MTTQSQTAVVARELSERTGRRDPGSVLQALQGLNPSLLPTEPRQTAPQGPSCAFLPARPGKRTLSPEGTGVIDVRVLAAMGLRRTQAPVATPSPASRPAATRTSALRPASLGPSPRMLEVRAFVLGVLCAGALMGALLVRVAASAPDRAPPTAAVGCEQPGPSVAHVRP